MPDPDPPVTAEEEQSMDQLLLQAAVATVSFHVHVMTPLYLIAHGIFDPFTREPPRWPFRFGVMPEHDPT